LCFEINRNRKSLEYVFDSKYFNSFLSHLEQNIDVNNPISSSVDLFLFFSSKFSAISKTLVLALKNMVTTSVHDIVLMTRWLYRNKLRRILLSVMHYNDLWRLQAGLLSILTFFFKLLCDIRHLILIPIVFNYYHCDGRMRDYKKGKLFPLNLYLWGKENGYNLGCQNLLAHLDLISYHLSR